MRQRFHRNPIYKVLTLLLFSIIICSILQADNNAPPQQMVASNIGVSQYTPIYRYVEPITLPREPVQMIDQWYCAQQYRNAANNKDLLYKLISNHLVISTQMLSSSNINIKRMGLGVALQAGMCASEQLDNDSIAISICDNYILPNIQFADQERCNYLNTNSVATKTILIFENAGELQRAVDGYKYLLAWEPNGNSADATRVGLASVLDEQGKYEEAISYLSQISADSSVAGAKDMLLELEKKLAGTGQN